MSLIWLIAFVVFLVVEGVTTSLTSIWFAGGSLPALVVQECGGGLYPQLAVFVAVSFMLFLMVRPFAYKYLYGKRTKTNVDSLTGRKAVVKDRIDNVAGTGTAILAGETWLARAAEEGESAMAAARAAEEGDTFEAGDVVVISAVSGAKLLVAAAKQEHEVEKA